ncbi:MAG: HD domain-containing protein [Nitrospirae bacterium]|nr:HD domain-containing protein [Nitrospirota bacterium]MBF0542404.1 HD domain-containing protein [Nitrospirota bacterium]
MDNDDYSTQQIHGDILDAKTKGEEVKPAEHCSTFCHMVRIGTALSAEKNLDKLLEMIIVEGMNFTNADGGTLYIMSEDEKSLQFKIIQNRSMKLKMGGTSGVKIAFAPIKLYNDNGLKNESNVSAKVAHSGIAVNIPDVYHVSDLDFAGTKKFDAGTGYRSKSMLVTAMRNHEDNIIGVLQLINATDESGNTIDFSAEHNEIITSLASLAATAITNATLIKEQKELFDGIILVIAKAIDRKSKYTGGHIRRVAELTMTIARALGESEDENWKDFTLSPDEETELRIAAWLHDIGKITTPEYVVDKGKKLETIYNRLNTVLARIEIFKRDLELDYLRRRSILERSEDSNAKIQLKDLDTEFAQRILQLKDDAEFLKVSDIGGEFMADDKIERVKEIAKNIVRINDEEVPLLSANEVENLSIRRGTLTDAERLIIQNHVVVSIQMLYQLPWPKKLQHVCEYAGEHHEKLNGTGYPHGLSAEDLSTKSRIIVLSDIFEALTAADRPYKDGKKLSESMKIINFMVKDGHLDKNLVEFFVKTGLVIQYAKKELVPHQIDNFIYDGVEYKV